MSKVTVTQMLEYRKRVFESRGFDVGDITRDESLMLPVRPISLDSPCILEWMGGFSKLALDEHNKNKVCVCVLELLLVHLILPSSSI